MNNLVSLSSLFVNKIFRIPDYQRGYAWQISQLTDFWEDLKNLTDNRYHYTGMLSLKKLKPQEYESWTEEKWLMEVDPSIEAYHIVDGQQRLTTFIILVNAVISKAISEKIEYLNNSSLEDIKAKYIVEYQKPHKILKAYKFGYEKDNPSFQFLRYSILGEESPSALQETFYTLNLEQAKCFFDNKVAELYKVGGVKALEVLFSKLVNKLQFNIHNIDDDFDVFVAFETMNNRGKSLSNLEILKNRLIYLTTIFPEDVLDINEKQQMRFNINDTWREIYYQLGRNKKHPLNDDEYLKNHWIIYFAYSRNKGDDYINFLLNRMFTANSVYGIKSGFDFDTQPYDDTYSDDNLTSDYVDDAFDDILYPNEITNYIKSIKDIAKHWYDSYFPYESSTLSEEEKIWIDRLNRIGIGYFRPLVTVVLSKRQTTTITERIELFKAIERFIFILFRLGNINYSYHSSEFYKAARNIYLNSVNISEVTNTLNKYSTEDTEYAIKQFAARIKKRFDSGDGYYGWNAIKYFLYEYEFSLAERNGITKISWELFSKSERDKVSIEHILPQDSSKEYWQTHFHDYLPDRVKVLSGALGNLLPLRQSVNSSLQNDSFDDKKHPTNSGRSGYENGSHSEIEVSKIDIWNAKAIYNRSVHLLKFMQARWNFILTDEAFNELVFISFVSEDE